VIKAFFAELVPVPDYRYFIFIRCLRKLGLVQFRYILFSVKIFFIYLPFFLYRYRFWVLNSLSYIEIKIEVHFFPESVICGLELQEIAVFCIKFRPGFPAAGGCSLGNPVQHWRWQPVCGPQLREHCWGKYSSFCPDSVKVPVASSILDLKSYPQLFAGSVTHGLVCVSGSNGKNGTGMFHHKNHPKN
jgi:hypothetical protein